MAYKILWYSIPALHDNTNGAAIHSKIMMEALARRGIEIKVLNALVGDDVHGLEVFNRIAQVVGDTKERKFLQFTDNGIEYIVAKTKGHLTRDITNEDQNTIFDLYLQLLDKFQPDMVMGYSGDIFSSGLRREAKMRGMTVAYALHNGLHRGFSFIDCDLVFSPSEASAKMYHEGDGTDVKAVGQFIDKSRILATKRDQPDSVKYVTLVNPTPEKGLAIYVKLYEAFVKYDASLLETNPMAVLRDGTIVALDAKMSLDDNALYRHPGLEGLRDFSEEDPFETQAKSAGLSYIALDGDIACMVNGAGLAMATMDTIKLYGAEPANFLDVGGGASVEKVTAAFEIMLSNPKVKAILINIFGGIMRCDTIAEGVVAACHAVKLSVPLVVRMNGTNEETGRRILKESGLSIIPAASMSEAAQKVIEASRTAGAKA